MDTTQLDNMLKKRLKKEQTNKNTVSKPKKNIYISNLRNEEEQKIMPQNTNFITYFEYNRLNSKNNCYLLLYIIIIVILLIVINDFIILKFFI